LLIMLSARLLIVLGVTLEAYGGRPRRAGGQT